MSAKRIAAKLLLAAYTAAFLVCIATGTLAQDDSILALPTSRLVMLFLQWAMFVVGANRLWGIALGTAK